MNILVATTPSLGHINPLLPLVQHLVGEGHRVCWYTGQAFQQQIEAVGAEFAPIVRAVDHGGQPKTDAFPQLRGLQGLADFIASWKVIFLDNAPRHMEDMLEILSDFPADVLLSDETTFGMGFVREKTGLPHVMVSTSIYFFRSRDTAPIGVGMLPNSSFIGRLRNRIIATVADWITLREVRIHATNIRRSVKLRPLRGGVLQNVTLKPDLYLMATIPEFEYPRSDYVTNTHFIGSLNQPVGEDQKRPAWWDRLQADQPVVHLTQGTVSNNDADQLLRPAIEGLSEQDVLIVVTTGGLAPEDLDLGALPDNVIVEPFIPHDVLLPKVDVMVTNGGYGGVQQALQYGVPLVVAGATEEKPEVAARVEWASVGINLRKAHPTPKEIAQATMRVLNDETYTQHAKQMQAQFAQYDAPALAIEWIEELLAHS